MISKTPKSDNLERTRIALKQQRTPAYGDALALCKKLETELDNTTKERDKLFELANGMYAAVKSLGKNKR